MRAKDGCAAHAAYQEYAKQHPAAKPVKLEPKRKAVENVERNGSKKARHVPEGSLKRASD